MATSDHPGHAPLDIPLQQSGRPVEALGSMRRTSAILLLASLALATGCASTRPDFPGFSRDRVEVGTASYYTARDYGGRTASGERYDDHDMTAAHRTLPFGTRVRVTNLENGRSVIVTINDRGPFRKGRVIDVSKRAARTLGFLREGTTRVKIEVVD
jgi:rare lipoprotein A